MSAKGNRAERWLLAAHATQSGETAMGPATNGETRSPPAAMRPRITTVTGSGPTPMLLTRSPRRHHLSDHTLPSTTQTAAVHMECPIITANDPPGYEPLPAGTRDMLRIRPQWAA